MLHDARFVDLCRNFSSTVGAGNIVLGAAVPSFRSIVGAGGVAVGETFYYSIINLDHPSEREVGRGTIQPDGVSFSRDPISGGLIAFTAGIKSVSLVAAAEWFQTVHTATRDVTPFGISLTDDADAAAGRGTLGVYSQAEVDAAINAAVVGLLDFKGNLDASGQPNYPAASKSDTYVITVAGKVGGAAGKAVDIGDLLVAKADNAGGTEAAVGANWFIVEHNLVGALLSANNLSDLASAAAARGNLGLGTAALEASRDLKINGSTFDGVTNDEAEIEADTAVIHDVYAPVGTSIVTELNLPVSTKFRTAGFLTNIKQAPGTAPNIRVLNILSNTVIESMSVEGQLNQGGSDTTGEQNFGFKVLDTTPGSLQNINIGSIIGKNIRGDSIYIGASVGQTVKAVITGAVIANNNYRNAVTISGGARGVVLGPIIGGTAGMTAFDIEPNSGENDVMGVHVPYIEGRSAQISGTGQRVGGVYIGCLNLSPTAFGAGSTPAYPTYTPTNAVQFRACDIRIGKIKTDGYDGGALVPAGVSTPRSRVSVGDIEMSNMTLAAHGANGWIVGSGPYISYNIEFLTATTPNAADVVIANLTYSHVDYAEVSLLTGSRYIGGSTSFVHTHLLNLTKADAGAGGIAIISAASSGVFGGTAVCDYFFSFATRCFAFGCDITTTSGLDLSGTNNVFMLCRLNATYYLIYANNGAIMWDAAGNLTTNGNIVVNSPGVYKAGGVTLFNTSGILQAAAHPALTGDVTTVQGALATTIAANAVTYAKFQQVAASSLVGNPTGSLANAQAITLVGALGFSGTTLRTQTSTNNVLVGRTTAGAGQTEELTVAGGLGFVGTALTINGAINAATSIAIAGAISSSGGKIGYATGAGGVITQATNKSTAVTINKLSGQITMNAASLAANTGVAFTVNNSQVAATDTIDLALASGNVTAGTYNYQVDKVSAGSFVIWVKNISAGALLEALVFNFSIKGAANA